MACNASNTSTGDLCRFEQNTSASPIMGKAALRAALIGSALLSSTALVQAQDGTEDTLLEALVISAAGTATDVTNAPASISVITAEDIADSPAQDVRELLKNVPGITINHSGNLDKVGIRGLSERYTLFLIDGKRVNSAPNVFRGNDFDSGWVPVEAIERIEVVRGAMSSLYGSDAIGGVVNIITKKNSDTWHGSVTTEYVVQENRQSGDYGRVGFNLSGPIIKDKLLFKSYGSYDFRFSDDFDINSSNTSSGNDSLGFLNSRDKFIDNTVTWLANDANEVDLNYGYSHRVQDITRMQRHSAGVTHRGYYDFGDTELKIYGDRIHNEYGHGNNAGTDQPNTAYNFNADGRINKEIDVLVPQTLTVGTSFSYQKIEDDYVLTDGSSSVWQAGLFIEDQMRISDRFELTFGSHFDQHENFGFHASPRAYGVINLSDSWTLKGGVSTSFKAPTLLENSSSWYNVSCGGSCYLVGSDDLDPEIGRTVEVGINYESDVIAAGVTIFRNDITDMIPFPPARTSSLAAATGYSNYVGLSSDGKPMFSYENIDQARTQGIEASLTITPRDDLTVTANYTYLDAKALSGVERPLAYQPQHSANVNVDWQATDKFNLGVQVNYFGNQYTYVPSNGNMANASKADAYVTADVIGSYKINTNFSVKAGVINIADKQIYRETSDDFNVDGRRYFLSATASF